MVADLHYFDEEPDPHQQSEKSDPDRYQRENQIRIRIHIKVSRTRIRNLRNRIQGLNLFCATVYSEDMEEAFSPGCYVIWVWELSRVL